MDAAAERELRELRARAYGRDADIAMDAAAVRRLRELESARGVPVASQGAAPGSAPAPAPPARTRAEARAVTALAAPPAEPSPTQADTDGLRSIERAVDDDSDADDAETQAVRSDDRRRSRRATWWAASVVGSAAIAAAVTFTLASTPPVSASSGAPQIATLQLTGASDRIPEGWFGAGSDTLAADFFGFTVFAISNWGDARSGDGDQPNCIGVVRTDAIPPVEGFDPNDWGYGGDFSSACDVGVFPATVELPLGGNAPEELIARHPSAVAVQFVLDGDRIGVFLDSGLG